MATLNEGTEIFNDVDFSFALSDFSVIQAAADSNDVFGIRIEMTTLNDTWNIGSSEFNEATPSIRIGLSAVPEPTAVTFGMFALAGLIVRRKRCR